ESMSKFLIKNADIGNLDDLSVSTKDIYIEDGFFKKIGKISPSECPGATIIDAHNMLALPGFVDCHSHVYQTFIKGPLDDLVITEWLVRLFTFEQDMDDEDYYYATLLSCLSALRFGTTTINEMGGHEHMDATLQAFEDAGIRVTYGISTTDIPENEVTPILSIDEALKLSQEVYDKAHGRNNGLMRASVAPAGLPAVSKDMAINLKKFANDKGLVYHTHLGEGKMETENVAKAYGTNGEGEALASLGILDKHTLLAHSIWLSDHEIDLIKESGAVPVHCPNTNMKISDGIPKIAQMLKKGIPVAIGCDGEASSATKDMIREAKAGSYLQKAVTLDPTVMDASTTFKMMTINGARALGYEDLGEIKEGNQADLILVNMEDDFSLTDRDHRIGNLLYAGTGHAVDTVFVRGQLKLRNKHIQGFDEQFIIRKCNDLIHRLNVKTGYVRED
ncbi:MAG: amidohydrolase, partial [Erysipelotrichaceae bacterium]|nr:amidohydrolase [Erysipelotrichaceae bacterium]